MHFFHGYLSQTKFAYFISQTMTVEYTDFAINERNTPRVTQFFTRHYINIVFADINGIERKMRYDRTLWQSFLSFYYLTTVFVVYMVLRLMFDLFSPHVDFYYCVKLTGIKEREREKKASTVSIGHQANIIKFSRRTVRRLVKLVPKTFARLRSLLPVRQVA